jgi:hypothetical protein
MELMAHLPPLASQSGQGDFFFVKAPSPKVVIRRGSAGDGGTRLAKWMDRGSCDTIAVTVGDKEWPFRQRFFDDLRMLNISFQCARAAFIT